MLMVLDGAKNGGVISWNGGGDCFLIAGHFARGFEARVGWLSALADKQLRAAMSAMHEDPAHPWTLQTLAARAGMFRTIFASRFNEVVGSSVMEYLRRWRMLLAAGRLRHTNDALSEIALSLGYESESAF